MRLVIRLAVALGLLLSMSEVATARGHLRAAGSPVIDNRVRTSGIDDDRVGALEYSSSYATLAVTVLSYTGPTTLPLGQVRTTPTFSAVLTSQSGDPIAGEVVVFRLNGGWVCQGTTQADGAATCAPAGIAIVEGDHTMEASFAGDSSWQASSTGPLRMPFFTPESNATTTRGGCATSVPGSWTLLAVALLAWVRRVRSGGGCAAQP